MMPESLSKIEVRKRQIQWLLFAAAFITFAYFHQGGGWNQNGRFAMVRAMVEEKRFSIDSYLIYCSNGTEDKILKRLPLNNAEYRLNGKSHALVWSDSKGQTLPINRKSIQNQIAYVDLAQVGTTGDVAYFNGHFHPNKAPGTSLLAVPAYSAIYSVEKVFGVNPDGWWTLTVNAWLTSLLSVGILSALGVVIFYRLALDWTGRILPSLLAAVAFAFGTMFFPYATMLYEHNIMAVALLASFYLLHRLKAGREKPDTVVPDRQDKSWYWLFLSGFCAGYASITNYIVAPVVIMLAVYLFRTARRKNALFLFGLGVLVPFIMICAYHIICFDTPFTTNYRNQNPIFNVGSCEFLNVFVWPQWQVLIAVLISPFRGLFFTAPVLLLGIFGIVQLFGNKEFRAEAWLCSCVIGFFLLFNISFYNWQGGWGTTPRYLMPALPFLAAPMVFGFARYFKTACVLAILSISIMSVTTIVDPQSNVGYGNAGAVPGRANFLDRPLAASFSYNPLTEYELPLLFTGRPGPFLQSIVAGHLKEYDRFLADEDTPSDVRLSKNALMRSGLESSVAQGDANPFPIASFDERISVNTIGIYEGWFYQVSPPHTTQARSNSFNAGELLFPHSVASLLPLMICVGLILIISLQKAVNADALLDKGNP